MSRAKQLQGSSWGSNRLCLSLFLVGLRFVDAPQAPGGVGRGLPQLWILRLSRSRVIRGMSEGLRQAPGPVLRWRRVCSRGAGRGQLPEKGGGPAAERCVQGVVQRGVVALAGHGELPGWCPVSRSVVWMLAHTLRPRGRSGRRERRAAGGAGRQAGRGALLRPETVVVLWGKAERGNRGALTHTEHRPCLRWDNIGSRRMSEKLGLTTC